MLTPFGLQAGANAAPPHAWLARLSVLSVLEELKQRLLNRLRLHHRGHGRLLLWSSEENPEVAADPLLRLAVVAELALVLVEAAVVVGAEHMVQVLVVDHGLHEERGDVGG